MFEANLSTEEHSCLFATTEQYCFPVHQNGPPRMLKSLKYSLYFLFHCFFRISYLKGDKRNHIADTLLSIRVLNKIISWCIEIAIRNTNYGLRSKFHRVYVYVKQKKIQQSKPCYCRFSVCPSVRSIFTNTQGLTGRFLDRSDVLRTLISIFFVKYFKHKIILLLL